jgi:hypothetical protein
VPPAWRKDVQLHQGFRRDWSTPLDVVLVQPLGGYLEFLARLQVLAQLQMPAEPVEGCFGQQPEVCLQGHLAIACIHGALERTA